MRMRGKRVIITGATSGLGKATALALARQGASLILTGRNAHLGEALIHRIEKLANAEARFLPCDLTSQKEVRALASEITKLAPAIDVLINNAGARFDTYQETVDGLERTMALNHLSHFLLTALLLEPLQRAPAARIITIGSTAHAGASDARGWFLSRDQYDRRLAYANSKAANIIFAYDLAERLKNTNITANAVGLGSIATNFSRNNGFKAWAKHLLSCVRGQKFLTATQGADTIVYLASSPEVQGVTGRYFQERKEVQSNPLTRDRAAAQRLWKQSLEKTGLTNPPPLFA